MKRVLVLAGIVLSVAVFPSVHSFADPPFASSVDAIAVYPYDDGIRWTEYGHTPAVPQPASTPLTWGWTAPQTIPGTLGGPLGSAPIDTDSEIAFDRDGNAWVTWSRLDMVFGGPPCVDPSWVIASRVFASRYNGATRSWSAPAVISGGQNLEGHSAIAADVDGRAISVWLHSYYHQHGSCEEGLVHTHTDVRHSVFNGASWSAPSDVPGGATFASSNPAIAFLGLNASAGGGTRSRAVVVWEDASSFDLYGFGATYRLFFASWNGTGFASSGSVAPDGPGTGRKVDIAAMRAGSALVGYNLVQDDGNHVFGNIYSAATGGFVGPATDSGIEAIDPGTAVEPDNTGHIFYTKLGPSGMELHDRVLGTNGAWGADTQIGEGLFSQPASVHHDRILVGGAIPAGLVRVNGVWVGAAIPQPAHVVIAAHTGSPNLPHAEWTYAAYASNTITPLLPLAGDRAEMQVVGSSARLNGLLFFKDAPWNAPVLGVKREMTGGEIDLSNKYTADTGQVLGGTNFGDPQTLRRWLAWVAEAYPSVRTGFDFWDHGNGWAGGNSDRLGLNSYDRLEVPEYRAALSGGLGTRTADLLVFDECAMAQLEVAHDVREFGRYMVASEDCLDLDGLEYNDIYGRLSVVPQPTLPVLVAQFIADFDGRYNGLGGNDSLAGINLGSVGAVATALSSLADAITGPGIQLNGAPPIFPLYALNDATLDAARIATQQVATSRGGCTANGCQNDFIDLWDLAERIRTGFGGPLIPARALALRNAIDAAVSPAGPDHEHHEPAALGFHGLSIYFERSGAQWTANSAAYGQLRLAADTNYDRLIDLYTALRP